VSDRFTAIPDDFPPSGIKGRCHLISTALSYDIILAAAHHFHMMNENAKASLEKGVKTIEAEEVKQGGSIPNFSFPWT